MRNKLCLLPALALTALLISDTAGASQQITLRWKFEDGQRIAYRMTVTNETELPNNMGTAVSENIMTTGWEVLDINAAGDATVRVSTDRVQMRTQSPMGNMEADSASDTPATDATARMMTAMAGTSYTLVFDAAGQIKEVRGFEDMRARLRESAPPEAAGMLDELLDQIASEDGIRNMMRQGMAAFPLDPVGPGDTWDVSFDMTLPMMGTMTTTTVMTFDRIERRGGSRIAVIRLTGTIELTPDENPDNPMAGLMEMGNSTSTGTMEWDIDRGLLLKNTSSMAMDMTLSMSGQQTVMGVSANMTIVLVEDGG